MVLVGVYLLIWGSALLAFEDETVPVVVKPFEDFDVAIKDAVATVDKLPITVHNFTLKLGRSASLAFDTTIVSVNNLLPNYLPTLLYSVINGKNVKVFSLL